MAKKSLIKKNIFIYKNFKKNKKNFSLFFYLNSKKIDKKKLLIRFKRRCYISGRSRSIFKRFDLNRNFIRKIGLFGYIIGLEKSSW
ncbi:ribosomal protein S14 [Candidatus Carsonella ruddii CS isolate Thao2000]|uniref:Ribosomal protein S14 n=1 Tax=Candidatus Carsonella ruddii CS isolate Thao2000 TaxID=1202537 RepID=J7GYX9_CARRU|nr:uS14 family ribosomal protein [Candidatus Carsonella ruddii]AFP83818.1 ribosomal protein S14 [Candidatus Carsonella ruddii CS isolate Thao2000]